MFHMCPEVKDKKEEEFDYYLSLARIFDEGWPSIDHVHDETSSIPRPHGDDISEKCDPTPEECATSDAPSRVEKKPL